jgi:hypothetical protein
MQGLLRNKNSLDEGNRKMKKSLRFVMGIPVLAFLLAGMIANPAMAQDKAKDAKAAPAAKAEKGKASTTILAENDKVKVSEARLKPGDEAPNVPRGLQVVRCLKGGEMQRTYADGKVEKVTWKAGEVRIVQPAQFTPKNIGKTEVVFYIVELK